MCDVHKIKVAVGSTNGVKVKASQLAFSSFFECEVKGVYVPSGVSSQPFGDETIEGARNRARSAIDVEKADFGVGIEGGIHILSGRKLAFAAVCIVDKKGKEGISLSGMFPLPREALVLIEKGKELGEAMDELTGMKDTKRGPGAIGLLTKGVIDRTKLYRDAVVFALVPFINEGFGW